MGMGERKPSGIFLKWAITSRKAFSLPTPPATHPSPHALLSLRPLGPPPRSPFKTRRMDFGHLITFKYIFFPQID